MARYVDAIDLPVPIGDAFDYLAEFSRAAEWDPGVVAGRQLTPDPIGVGTRFEVIVSFLGRRIPMEYEITRFERPHRLILEGGDGAIRSIDELTFAPRGDGTRVTYEARLELPLLLRWADPLLHAAFQRIGASAARGLRARTAAEIRRATNAATGAAA